MSIFRFVLYLIRWQLSTIILAPVVGMMTEYNPWLACSVANLIGGIIFYFIDKTIFTNKRLNPIWEVSNNTECVGCKKNGRGYRLVKAKNYDRTKDKSPQFRCEQCSELKLAEIRLRGIKI